MVSRSVVGLIHPFTIDNCCTPLISYTTDFKSCEPEKLLAYEGDEHEENACDSRSPQVKQEINGLVDENIINSLFSPSHIEKRLDYYVHSTNKPKRKLGSIGLSSCIHYSYEDWNATPVYSRYTNSVIDETSKSNQFGCEETDLSGELQTPASMMSMRTCSTLSTSDVCQSASEMKSICLLLYIIKK